MAPSSFLMDPDYPKMLCLSWGLESESKILPIALIINVLIN